MANQMNFEAFLSALNFTSLYLQRFKDTGYDDLDLLMVTTDEELNKMFDVVGMPTKPGHILKFKKSLGSLKKTKINPSSSSVCLNESTSGFFIQESPNLKVTIQKPQNEQMKKQKTISFIAGKFVVAGNAQVADVKPWQKFQIPNVKTDGLTFYNSITKNLYKCAYTKKQSLFQGDLERQRKFRWGIKMEIENIQKKFESYQSGVVPIENITLEWYQSGAIPSDVRVDDVGKSERALKHVRTTKLSIAHIKIRPLNRKKELIDVNMAPKDWAHDDLEFIDSSVEQLTPIMNELESLEHNLQFVHSQVQKRFDSASILHAEKIRSARRQKEQRAKVAKKKRMLKMIAALHDESDNDEDTDSD